MSDVVKLNYSLDEAAAALNLSIATVKRLVARGELPSHKYGSRRLVSVAQLERFNEAHADGWVEDARVTRPTSTRRARRAG